jgi:hypothetical protein
MKDERDVAQDPDEARALRALDEAERLTPPADFVSGVMRQLSPKSNVLGDRNPEFWSPDRRRQSSGGGTMSSRKVLLGIAAVAVLAIAYFAVTGFPPTGPGSEATIGAAKRYQSEQISSKDVVLQKPEVQRVLQSDSFHKLVSNPQTRALLASKEFQKAMRAGEVQALIQEAADSADLVQQLDGAAGDKAVNELWSYLETHSDAAAELDAAFDNAAFEKALDAATEKAADASASKALDSAIKDAIQDAGLEKLLLAAVDDASFAGLLGNEAFQAALENPAFVALMAEASFAEAFSDEALLEAISDPAFFEAVEAGALEAAIEQAASGAASGAAVEKATDAAQGKDGAQEK